MGFNFRKSTIFNSCMAFYVTRVLRILQFNYFEKQYDENVNICIQKDIHWRYAFLRQPFVFYNKLYKQYNIRCNIRSFCDIFYIIDSIIRTLHVYQKSLQITCFGAKTTLKSKDQYRYNKHVEHLHTHVIGYSFSSELS